MIRLAKFFQFDPDDSGDLNDFVKWLLNICLWFFVIATSIIMLVAIFKAGDGGLPPEPEWWVRLRSAMFSYWMGG